MSHSEPRTEEEPAMQTWLRTLGLTIVFTVVVGKLSPLIAADAPGPLPPLGEVDAQPLAANVKRVIEALQSRGSPLPAEEVERLQTAAKERDARQLQKLLDPR